MMLLDSTTHAQGALSRFSPPATIRDMEPNPYDAPQSYPAGIVRSMTMSWFRIPLAIICAVIDAKIGISKMGGLTVSFLSTWVLGSILLCCDNMNTGMVLSHEDVRAAIRTFLATSSDAKNIGFIRISGEGLEQKQIVTAPDSDYVRFGPWQVNVVTRDVILESKKALLEGEVVQSKGKLTVKINRIIWHRVR